ncbi:MAG: hypothetical protein PHW60_11320 [Kiritimatiellae bacterium]|nr:hypothetical protein [Kiritimatiellia bacterium]
MKKRIIKTLAKVETKNQVKNQAAVKATPAQNEPKDVSFLDAPKLKLKLIADNDPEHLFEITKNAFVLETVIDEYLDHDGKWKQWDDPRELNGKGIIIRLDEKNPRLRARSERTIINREAARQWLVKTFIDEEFQPDFGVAAGCSKDAKEKPEASRADDKDNTALAVMGLITLTQIYDETVCTQKFENAVYVLDGIGELIKHHPALQPEVAAIRDIVAGELVLNRLRRHYDFTNNQDKTDYGKDGFLQIYDDLICEKDFEAAIHMLENLEITIAHNPALKTEVEAIRAIVAGEGVLRTLRDRNNAL